MTLWLEHTMHNDTRYEVLSYDPSTKTAVLRGRYATIKQKVDVQSLKKAGYRLFKETSDAIKPELRT